METLSSPIQCTAAKILVLAFRAYHAMRQRLLQELAAYKILTDPRVLDLPSSLRDAIEASCAPIPLPSIVVPMLAQVVCWLRNVVGKGRRRRQGKRQRCSHVDTESEAVRHQRLARAPCGRRDRHKAGPEVRTVSAHSKDGAGGAVSPAGERWSFGRRRSSAESGLALQDPGTRSLEDDRLEYPLFLSPLL